MTPNQILKMQEENKRLVNVLRECERDFKWALVVVLCFGFSLGLMVKGYY
jgi:hypothetical protein